MSVADFVVTSRALYPSRDEQQQQQQQQQHQHQDHLSALSHHPYLLQSSSGLGQFSFSMYYVLVVFFLLL
jgi:hypothetical protein